MAQSNTIGGPGAPLNIAFTDFGSQFVNNYVDALVGAINSILGGGGSVTNVNEGGSGTAFFPGSPAPSTPIYNLIPSTVAGLTSQDFTITTAGYVVDTVGASVVINVDSAGGDSIIVTANNPSTTVNAAGTDNLVIFVDGNNLYNGAGSTGGDTVVGGSGNDTITTGAGNTTVNAGTGYDLITLNDTGALASGTFFNDGVYLDNGHATVIADGVSDYVVATAAGQTIEGGAAQTSGSNLTAVLLAGSTGDLLTGGAGYMTVIDQAGGNTIAGGAGGLTFIGDANVSDTIFAGATTALVFGNTGDDLTITGSGDILFSASSGNETLDGSAATGNLALYGASQSAGAGSAVDSLVGGAGNDTLVAGAGTESLTGGAGSNTFLIDAYGSQNANITITDFMGNDSVAFGHFTAADVAAAIAAGTQEGANFVITFATSNTTVTFDNATSSSLSGHTITFT
jgi:Ca2+-binding RTX toxin-like protein